MRIFPSKFVLLIAVPVLSAQTPNTIRVSQETVPAGSVAQVKVLVTAPQPISSGTTRFESDFDDIWGISLYSPTGDVMGAAVRRGGSFTLNFISPQGTFGTTLDYPVLTVAGVVRPYATVGQTFPVGLSPSSVWLNSLRQAQPMELKPGAVIVGGSLAIDNIVPGGGKVPAGYPVRILGTGFSAKTKVKTKESNIDSVSVINSRELQVRFRQEVVLDGMMFKLTNADNTSVTYYSYLRGVETVKSTNPLLAATVPIFSTNVLSEGLLQTTISSLNPRYATAVALQNPNRGQAAATVTLYCGRAIAGQATLRLDSGARITRELSEIFSGRVTPACYVHLASSQPLQAMGLLADSAGGAVQPLMIAPLAPGSFRP